MAQNEQQVETPRRRTDYRHFAFGWFTAMYAGVLTAGALEYKDKAYGSKWDWIDFGLTVAGAILGWLICSWL